MSSSLRARSLGGASIRKQSFTSSYWPDYTVEVRSISGARKMEIAKQCRDEEGDIDTAKLVPAMIIETVFDPATGERVYEAADRDALMEEAAAALDELWNVAVAPLNGYGDADKTEKNSTTPTSSPPSPSPANSGE